MNATTERPTPETDALEATPMFRQRPPSPECAEALLHARCMERQRDEEGERLESIGVACGFPKVTDHAQLTETICKKIQHIERQRDEARAKLSVVTAQRDKWRGALRTNKSALEFDDTTPIDTPPEPR